MKTYLGLALRNLTRTPGSQLMAASGVVLGVATFVFFVALGQGLRHNVLDAIFVVNQFEVVPRSLEIGAFRTRGLFGAGTGFSQATVDQIAAFDGVAEVYPKQNIALPAYAFGGESILGETLWTELVGDGIPPALVADDVSIAPTDPAAFVDWDAVTACTGGTACAPGSECADGVCVQTACVPDDEVWAASDAATVERLADQVSRDARIRRRNLEVRDAGAAVAPSERFRLVVNTGETESAQQALRRDGLAPGVAIDLERSGCATAPSYCQAEERVCRMPVPVLASRVLLELYNTNVQGILAASSDAPAIPQLTERAFIGLEFGARLGEGFLGQSRGQGGDAVRPTTLRLRVAGFSTRAIPVGVTVPLGYVERWNAEYGDADRIGQFDSLLVETVDSRALHGVSDRVVRELGFALHPRYEDAQRASLVLTLVTAGLGLLSLLIVGIAALNVMHTFVMQVSERRREIGVLRAVGATRSQVIGLVLLEAVVVALVAWCLAMGAALGAMHLADQGFASSVGDFPFKPTTLFDVEPWLVWGSLMLALGSCVLGAWVPALRSAAIDPIEALRG